MNMRLTVSLALALFVVSNTANAQSRRRNVSDGSVGRDPDISAIASDAYIFGYPLVSMYITKRVTTNVARPEKGRAPVNQVGNLLAYPTAAFKDVVAPNVNTLYSSIWLDLSRGPIVVHMPDTRGRYFVMQILDMWTNVIAAPGKRTTGTDAQEVAVAGPFWKGQPPPGITSTVRSPTNNVWIINRIEANGPRDYPVVNALQHSITTKPLGSFGTPYTWMAGAVDPTVDMKTPVKEQVNRMSARQFFTAMADAMKQNRPVQRDSAIVARMARIGLRAGLDFKPTLAMASEIGAGARAGLERIEQAATSVGRMENGWTSLANCGRYGTEYLTRAVVAFVGLGCNLPEDALYPATRVDADGKTLSGANRYVVHFPAGQEPPVKAFWSITMYDKNSYLVANPIDRSAVSSWNNLKKNTDGSIEIYLQHASPGADREANWLPAPMGEFALVMRLYWPEESATSGSWKPPAVKRLD